MLKNFRTYHLAVEFYRHTQGIRLPKYLKDQLNRASSSVVLNLAEGAGRQSSLDQKRFYAISLGSLRESQAILDLGSGVSKELVDCADKLAAHIYRLIYPKRT